MNGFFGVGKMKMKTLQVIFLKDIDNRKRYLFFLNSIEIIQKSKGKFQFESVSPIIERVFEKRTINFGNMGPIEHQNYVIKIMHT